MHRSFQIYFLYIILNYLFYRNPTPENSDLEVTWKPVEPTNKNVLVIGEDLELKSNLFEGRIKFWDNFIAKYKEKSVNGIIKDEL